MMIEIDDQPLLRKAKEVWGARWRVKLTEAILARTRAAIGLEADLSHTDAARELRVSKRTLTRRRAEGCFPRSYAVNSRVIRYPLSDIQAYKEKHQFIVT